METRAKQIPVGGGNRVLLKGEGCTLKVKKKKAGEQDRHGKWMSPRVLVVYMPS